ncbi:MAG: hypothetical protein ACM65M_27250 [Microcoleus sp.]
MIETEIIKAIVSLVRVANSFAMELSGDLRFEQLAIAQGTGISARDTFVRIAANQELLTILSDVPASSITDAAFAIMGT